MLNFGAGWKLEIRPPLAGNLGLGGDPSSAASFLPSSVPVQRYDGQCKRLARAWLDSAMLPRRRASLPCCGGRLADRVEASISATFFSRLPKRAAFHGCVTNNDGQRELWGQGKGLSMFGDAAWTQSSIDTCLICHKDGSLWLCTRTVLVWRGVAKSLPAGYDRSGVGHAGSGMADVRPIRIHTLLQHTLLHSPTASDRRAQQATQSSQRPESKRFGFCCLCLGTKIRQSALSNQDVGENALTRPSTVLLHASLRALLEASAATSFRRSARLHSATYDPHLLCLADQLCWRHTPNAAFLNILYPHPVAT
ncbi:uncharacterized protein PAN0_003c1587 [Moesziomyces antarcticus]|uniref:uncharacterized protein n=1 Tax=Pseudozyma antarctica TaxID=84753 RepID=UPI000719515B|nr:uncharacterized protein PAN0_003c1587 [Moesziomyces antarcticus]GAK63383.1 hypothetical protein PAN0_003c1587 [Moesziomyces antarcticus]